MMLQKVFENNRVYFFEILWFDIAYMWKICNKITEYRDTAAIEGSGAKLWKCPYGEAHLLFSNPEGTRKKILEVDMFYCIW